MSDTTPDATPRQAGTTRDTQEMTLDDATRHFGVSLRTIQRRLNKGTLQETARNGERLVIITSATDDTKSVTTKSDTVTTNDSLTRQPNAAFLEHLQAENEYLKEQINAWRLQAEAANRTASETAAALRKVLEALPKELPAAADHLTKTDTATTSTTSADPTPYAANDAPQLAQMQPDETNDQTTNASLEATESAPKSTSIFSRIMKRVGRR